MTTRLLTTQRIVNLAADPATGTSGELYFNTTNNVLRYHNGTAWSNFFVSQVKHLVKNDSGVTLPKGTVVYTSGANGTNILVKAALATTDQVSAQTLGFLETELTPNQSGYVITEGLISGINTSSASAGDPVWLSPTSAGSVVYGLENKPQAPNHLVYLGVVTRSNTNNGEIFIHISNGWELDELHNVKITNPQNNDILIYNSASSVWTNSIQTVTVSSGSAYPVSGLSNGQLFYNTLNERTAIYFDPAWREFAYVTDFPVDGGSASTIDFASSMDGGNASTLVFIGNYDGGSS